MRFRLVSYCSAALMASSAFIAPQALAAYQQRRDCGLQRAA